MKFRLLILVLAIVLCLSACKSNDKTNNNQSSEDSNLKPILTDLGVGSAENKDLASNARNPWDIAIIEDNLYVATGDYANDAGTTSIWKYDNASSKWMNSGDVEQEAIVRFVNLNGKNIAIGADPIGRPEYAENYVLKGNKWEVFSKIEGTLHTFDAEYFNNAIYFGVGYETDEYPVVKFMPETDEYTNIPLYKNGIDVIASLQSMANIEYKRVYDLFNVNGKLYCAFSVSYTGGKTTIEFFELKEDKFEFCQAFKASGMQMNKSVKNQMLFNADAVIGDSCYLSLGNLYKTDDFINFSKITVPDDACVTDLLVDKSGDSETLYVLAAVKNGDEFKNTIYRLDEGNLIEVYSFNHGCSALSFAKTGNGFYVGLGGDGVSSDDIGKVLKIELD